MPSLLSCVDMFNQQTVAGDKNQIKRVSQMSVTPATFTETRLARCADPEIISQSRTTTLQTPDIPHPIPNSAPAFCFATPSAMGGLLSCTLLMGLKLNVALFLLRWTQGTSFLTRTGGAGARGVKEAGCLALVPSCGGLIHPSR